MIEFAIHIAVHASIYVHIELFIKTNKKEQFTSMKKAPDIQFVMNLKILT